MGEGKDSALLLGWSAGTACSSQTPFTKTPSELPSSKFQVCAREGLPALGPEKPRTHPGHIAGAQDPPRPTGAVLMRLLNATRSLHSALTSRLQARHAGGAS